MNKKQNIRGGLSMKISTALVLAAASVALSAPALAHHSRTMFDSSISRVLRGTVNEFDFVNPHAFIIMTVENIDGTKTTWQLEGGNAMGLIRNRWRPQSLRAGDLIEVEINPLRGGAPGGLWNADDVMLFVDGSTTGIAPVERKD